MSTDNIIQLNKNTLFNLMSQLDPESLFNMCKTSKTFANICNDDEFWRYKYSIDFGSYSNMQSQSNPKKLYFESYLEKLQNLGQIKLENLYTAIHDIFLNAIVSDSSTQPSTSELIAAKDFVEELRMEHQEDIDLIYEPSIFILYTLINAIIHDHNINTLFNQPYQMSFCGNEYAENDI